MNSTRKQILYLCLDKGIKIGGTKGASVHIAEFMEALHEYGHGGRILATRKERRSHERSRWDVQILPESRDKSDAGFHELGEMSYAAQEADDFLRNIEAERALLATFESRPFDLVYERYSLFGLAGHLASRTLGVPHVLEVNAPLVMEAAAHRNLALTDLARSVERTLFASADHIIAVSQQVRSYILTVAPHAEVTVVPNGVNMRLFSESEFDESAGRVHDRPPAIGFVGALKPWHGAQILVDAFARLAARFPDASLIFVGDDTGMRDLLETQIQASGISGRVVFTGAVPHEQIPSALATLDIVCAPYPALDNFYFSPLKVYEYMAAGRAIVASNIGQISDFLSHDKNCLLVAPGRPEALAGALEQLLTDSSLRTRLGSQARADAVKNHSWLRRMDDISHVFEAVCSKHKMAVK